MSESDTPASPTVAVIGAGISGLAAAYRLRELAPELAVQVLEASPRAGGLIRTERIDNCLVELGPDSILSEKPAALNLALRLGLEDRILPTNTQNRGAYVVCRGRLEKIPDGFSMMAPARAWPVLRSPVLSLRGKLRLFSELLLPRARTVEPPQTEDPEESVGAFVRRRFGDEVLTRLAQPLMGGIYGTDVDELSLDATMPRFRTLEREHRSVTLGLLRQARRAKHTTNAAQPSSAGAQGVRYGLFFSFKGGNQTLIDALTAALALQLRFDTRATTLTRLDDGRFQVTLADGATLKYDAVILALPARIVSPLVTKLHPDLAEHLRDIPFGSTAAVHYCFSRDSIAHPLDAFGFVVPKAERRPLLASTWASVKFAGRAPEDQALIRVFFGGDAGKAMLKHDDATLVQLGKSELADLIGVRGDPLFTHVSRHPDSMPQYRVGHTKKIQTIERCVSEIPRLELAGNSLHGVGIPDAVSSGERAAERVLAALTK